MNFNRVHPPAGWVGATATLRLQKIARAFDSANHKSGGITHMDLFIRHPVLAIVPALLFAAAYVHRRVSGGRGFRVSRFVILSAGVVWVFYLYYELHIQQELKPEQVPIRVDLLAIYPALLIFTVLGITAYLLGFRSRSGITP